VSQASARLEAIQGYNVRNWSEAGLDFWAVSDIAPDELSEFGQMMVAALHPA
jgi:anti-sigma factor RsiW